MNSTILNVLTYITLTLSCFHTVYAATQNYSLDSSSVKKINCNGLDIDPAISSLKLKNNVLTMQESGKSARKISIVNNSGGYRVNRSSVEGGYTLVESVHFHVSSQKITSRTSINFAVSGQKAEHCQVIVNYVS